jgi:hypothetical protein
MKYKAVKIGFIASLLPHLFCCVLPILLSAIGLVAPGAAHIHIIPHYLEPWLFLFSALMLGLSWILVLRECRCGCDSCAKPKGHRIQKIILLCATAVFVLNIAVSL